VNVFAIRHGETAWSLNGQHTGKTDIPLTDNGRRLAARMRPVLAANPFGLVLCSPMRRARETCELAGLGERAIIDPDLVEWNYGKYEGLTPKQIDEVAPGWLIFRDGCPGGEVPEQVSARVDRVIARARGCRRHRAVRARTPAARICGPLDRIARAWWSALSAEHGDPVRARLLPRNTGCSDLEQASPRRGCVMIGRSESWNTIERALEHYGCDPVLWQQPR
jgi:broad specificity phosphatase PhoE